MIFAAVYGLLSAFLWGVEDFLSRKPSGKIGYYLTSSYSQPVGFVGIFIYGWLYGKSDFHLILSNDNSLLLNLAAGILSFLILLFLFRGYSTGVMSVVAPIAGSYPVVTLILSVLLLGEILVSIKAYAVIAVIVGIILAGVKLSDLRVQPATRAIASDSSNNEYKTEGERRPELPLSTDKLPSSHSIIIKNNRRTIGGVGSAIFACLCAGFAFFLLGLVTPAFGSILSVIILKGMASLTAFVLILPLNQKLRKPTLSVLLWIFVIGLMDVGGFLALSTGISLAGSELPIVVTLSALVSVVTIILARIFYSERLDKIQSLGILILLVGVATILYF